MKMKKILILISMLAVMLSLAGCSEEKEKPFNYNDAEMVISTMQLFERYVDVSSDYVDYYIANGSDFEQSAVKGIQQARDTDQVGKFEDYDFYLYNPTFDPAYIDYEIVNDDDSITVSIINKAENRDVRISVTYTENPDFYIVYAETAANYGIQSIESFEEQIIYVFGSVDAYLEQVDYALGVQGTTLQSAYNLACLDLEDDLIQQGYMKYLPQEMVVTAVYSKSELMAQAGKNTLIGMGTVFVVLIFISFIISLFKFLPALLAKKPKIEPEKMVDTPKPVVQSAPSAPSKDENLMNDAELVAVITAAIYAASGTTGSTVGAVSNDRLVVRSIRRVKR